MQRMELVSEKPMTANDTPPPRLDPLGMVLVLAISVLVGLLYVPLLHWLGWETLHTQQLVNGAFLVFFALVICVRDAVDKLRFDPQVSRAGDRFDCAGITCASAWRGNGIRCRWRSCCCRRAWHSRASCRWCSARRARGNFCPAVSAFFVFGVLVGLVPRLDWPLRAMAARYAGSLLARAWRARENRAGARANRRNFFSR